MSDLYSSPSDIQPLTRVRSVDINTLDQAIGNAFNKLPNEDEIKKGIINYAVDTGAANAYVVALPYAPDSYTDGLIVSFRAKATNTGASTINVNGLGVKSIRKTDGTALSAGDITADITFDVRYSSATGFFHIAPNSNVAAVAAAASAASAAQSAANADDSEAAATTSATAAENWAIKTTGPVSGGEYSAKKHAQDAANSAQAAADSAASVAGGPVASVNGRTGIVSGVLDTAGGTMTGPLNEAEGLAIASAATVNLDNATGNFLHITGTTGITAMTLAQGAERVIVFDAALTMTHSANLILPGAANITTAAGDVAIVRGEGAGVTRVVAFTKADGKPLVAPVSVKPFSNTVVLTASQTWTATFTGPHRVTVVGGGGSGASCYGGGAVASATGGGAGGLARKIFDATAGQTYTANVGAAGASPGNVGQANGNAGGQSSFVGNGIAVYGNGGGGGQAVYGNGTFSGGTGGTASGGDVNITGGAGGAITNDGGSGSGTVCATGGGAVAGLGVAYNGGSVTGTGGARTASGGAGVGGKGGDAIGSGGLLCATGGGGAASAGTDMTNGSSSGGAGFPLPALLLNGPGGAGWTNTGGIAGGNSGTQGGAGGGASAYSNTAGGNGSLFGGGGGYAGSVGDTSASYTGGNAGLGAGGGGCSCITSFGRGGNGGNGVIIIEW